MSNPYYTASGAPITGSQGYSATIRGEFASVAAGFALLPPTLTANKAVIINAGGTAMSVSTGSLTLNGDFTVATGKSLTANSTIILDGTDGATLSLGGNLTTAAGKTVSISNTLTFTGTDGSSVAFGAGGTVLYSGGAYASSITGTANEITASAATGAVILSLPAALTFTGKTVTGGTFAGGTFTTANIVGTATNDSAAAGSVGEFVESKVDAPGSTFSAGSGNAQNVTSISLTAGDWDVQGLINTNGATLSNMLAGIHSTSATQPSAAYINTIASPSANGSVSAPRRRFSLASTTTIYLVFTGFGASTPTIYGYINARRVR